MHNLEVCKSNLELAEVVAIDARKALARELNSAFFKFAERVANERGAPVRASVTERNFVMETLSLEEEDRRLQRFSLNKFGSCDTQEVTRGAASEELKQAFHAFAKQMLPYIRALGARGLLPGGPFRFRATKQHDASPHGASSENQTMIEDPTP